MEIDASIKNRKGPRKVQDVSEEVLALLNQGSLETVNLTEWLAVDHIKLVQNISKGLGVGTEDMEQITAELRLQKKPTSMSVNCKFFTDRCGDLWICSTVLKKCTHLLAGYREATSNRKFMRCGIWRTQRNSTITIWHLQ